MVHVVVIGVMRVLELHIAVDLYTRLCTLLLSSLLVSIL